MNKIILPNTNLAVSRLGFGTASLHHRLRSQVRLALLDAALDAGFTHFDTARMYGEGLAERELGDFFAGRLRQKVTIATKFGISAVPIFERFPSMMYVQRAFGVISRRLGLTRTDEFVRLFSPEAAEKSLMSSLKALKTDWIDIFFVHEPLFGDIQAIENLAEWLLRQKSCGRVRYLGLAGRPENCVTVMRQLEGLFDVLQVEDSLDDCEADIVLAVGKPLQVTFGYMRQAKAAQTQFDALNVLKKALVRNQNGMILVSSCSPVRLRALASVVDIQEERFD